jgi:SAM-dependent methyltransferase
MSQHNILDVGSGDRPIREADVLCDLHVIDNRQRGNMALAMDNRSFVQCDVETLPFRDKSLNFVYCNRVLEYTRNPDKAIQEMERVGASGYVGTPSLIFPNYYGAYSENNRLFFVRIDKTMSEIFPVRFRQMIFFHFFSSLINLFTGIFQTEFFWGNGLETFIRIYRSNNKELKPLPLFPIKILVLGRKKMQNLRDKVIIRSGYC